MASDGTSGDRLEQELRAALLLQADTVPPVPERIGRYRILRELGRGGMATIYLAEDASLQRQVAIKSMRGGLRFVGEARQRFQREALAASRLDHPGICHLYEIGEDGDTPFMVMRHVPGTTLAERIAAADAGETAADALLPADTSKRLAALVRLIETAARALHVAHEQGLVHRDLKPANLMVTPDGEPVLLDFGVAFDERDTEHSLTSTGQLIGTPLYMSPEQVSGVPRPDRRSDVYSLALTLYEAITLSRPFAAPTQRGIYERILEFEVPDPRRANPACPADLAVVLAVALDKDPDHRYRTALDFAEDLRRVQERRPIAARRPSLTTRTLRWITRNPMAASLVVVMGAAAATSSWLWRQASASERRFELAASDIAVRQARQEAARLYPSVPRMAAPLREWLEHRSRPLAERLPSVRQALADVTHADANDEASQFLRELLQRLVPDLERLVTADTEDVRRRLAWSEAVERETLARPRAEWDAAIAAIRASSLYGGLELRPQLGLVPLGPDAKSGLWEFHVPETGSRPERQDNGNLSVTADTGIVLVLIPGGAFWMGRDPEPDAREGSVPSSEQPRNRVELAPYFLGKYEVTQGQWLRIAHENRSSWRPDRAYPNQTAHGRGETVPITLVHPVESISSDRALEVLARVGLTLPSEAQWERAARPGDEDGVTAVRQGSANLHDASSRTFGTPGTAAPWDDRFPAHAPVGRFRPNAFGLHDLIGNVAELCGDWRASYGAPAAGDAGERAVPESERTARPVRGGSFGSAPSPALTTLRTFQLGSTIGGERTGCRAARPLDR